MLNISGVHFPSYVDGKGIRVVVFFSGCNHKCKGCHNPESWDEHHGNDAFDETTIKLVQETLDRPYCNGITLSGGDPMFNAIEVHAWLKKIRLREDQTVWCYTGDTINDIEQDVDKELLACSCDYIVVNPFIEELKTTTNGYFGSTNQRIYGWREEKLDTCYTEELVDVTNEFVESFDSDS